MHHVSFSYLTSTNISIALDKMDLKPYNLMRRCRRTTALQCFSSKKPLKPRQRATTARSIFQYCKNIFVSSTKRWIRTREKGLRKNRDILYTPYRNTPEVLQLLQQKFDYCTTAGSFRIFIIYTKKTQNKFLFWLCLKCVRLSYNFVVWWIKTAPNTVLQLQNKIAPRVGKKIKTLRNNICYPFSFSPEECEVVSVCCFFWDDVKICWEGDMYLIT